MDRWSGGAAGLGPVVCAARLSAARKTESGMPQSEQTIDPDRAHRGHTKKPIGIGRNGLAATLHKNVAARNSKPNSRICWASFPGGCLVKDETPQSLTAGLRVECFWIKDAMGAAGFSQHDAEGARARLEPSMRRCSAGRVGSCLCLGASGMGFREASLERCAILSERAGIAIGITGAGKALCRYP
jgi:hypothetical protein